MANLMAERVAEDVTWNTKGLVSHQVQRQTGHRTLSERAVIVGLKLTSSDAEIDIALGGATVALPDEMRNSEIVCGYTTEEV